MKGQLLGSTQPLAMARQDLPVVDLTLLVQPRHFTLKIFCPPPLSQTGSATDSYSVKIAQMKHGMFEFQFVITENSLAV